MLPSIFFIANDGFHLIKEVILCAILVFYLLSANCLLSLFGQVENCDVWQRVDNQGTSRMNDNSLDFTTKLSSANAFNFGKAKILLSDKG